MRGSLLDGLLDRPDDAGRRASRALELALRAAPHRLIVGHRTVAGQHLSDLSVHAQYLHLTDALIVKIVAARPDTVIFLDKSARPVSWLVKELWPVSALVEPDPAARHHPRPRFCYLNIDREQWRDTMDPDGSGGFDVSHVPAASVAGLRRSFIAGDAAGITDEEVWNSATMLSGQKLLVIDEVAVSGDTLRIACSLIARAFPDSEVSHAHWMTPRLVKVGENRFNNQVPVWYRQDTPLGRLVGDRDPQRAARSATWRTRSAAWFLSLPHPTPDIDGLALRLETRQLVGELLLGRLPLVPAFDREGLDVWTTSLTGLDPPRLREWRETHEVLLLP